MKNFKFKKSSSILIIFFVLLSAIILFVARDRSGPVQLSVRHYIKNNCPEISKCIVKIADFTDFEWEEMYYLGGGDYFAEPLPVELPEKHSFLNNKFLFISNGRLVFYEEVPMNFEYTPNGSVVIDASDSTKFTPETAKFSVQIRESTDSDRYYYLTQIQP